MALQEENFKKSASSHQKQMRQNSRQAYHMNIENGETFLHTNAQQFLNFAEQCTA